MIDFTGATLFVAGFIVGVACATILGGMAVIAFRNAVK